MPIVKTNKVLYETMENVNIDNLLEAQAYMRNNYGYGSIGIFVSGTVWILASSIISLNSAQQGIWTLIIGGMFIFPLSTLPGKLIGIKGRHHKNSPIAKLVMEGTIWMIMCIPIAYGLSLVKTEWFFQRMLMIIARRYLTFASIYGMRLYWVLGAALGLAAYLLF